MLVIKVTKSEFIDIMRYEGEGGHMEQIIYEIIEEDAERESIPEGLITAALLDVEVKS